MSEFKSFFETLNRLHFPHVKKYKSSDFDTVFSDSKLKSFLESLSCLNEENALSSEELHEYEEIPPEELENLENLLQNEDSYQEDVSEEKEKEEEQFLQQHLSIINEHNETLIKQKEVLKFHHNKLLEERDYYRKILTEAKKVYDTYDMQKIPQSESELITAFQSTFCIINELENLITEPGYDSQTIPPSSFKKLESYFEEERQILNLVNDFLQKDLQITGDPKHFTVKIPGCSEFEMQKEVCFLRKILKLSKVAEIEAYSSREKMNKIVKFYRKFEEKNFPRVFQISSSQVWNKIAEEDIQNEKLIEKEKILKIYLLNAISEHVDALCYKIGTACSKEVLQTYNDNLEKIQIPLEYLTSQRSRLEAFIFYLHSYQKKLENIKQLIESTSSFVEKEKEAFQERKHQYEEELQKPILQKSEYLSDNFFLLSGYEILCDAEQQDLTFISMSDLIEKIEKLQESKKLLEKEQEKKLNTLTILEEHRAILEKFIFKGKKFSDLLHMDLRFNAYFNKLHLKLFKVLVAYLEAKTSKKEKLKLIEKRDHQELARSLFIFAVTNVEAFKFWIEEIKKKSYILTDDTSQC
ncbi:uncharacterized protein TNIN_485951 [Trichonephila inaurata madagascariensis]|uniref:Uncharacterized protein n=1 Tax=Trichonephila inaurata madagascariensis TaxID=2747483 RepID=A0A8X6YUI7_9ARAC|nr:uncharacterized protein TNIN_485951 [Trichonephila inaurata madagascariensis]